MGPNKLMKKIRPSHIWGCKNGLDKIAKIIGLAGLIEN